MANEKVRLAVVGGGMSIGQALSQWVFRKVLHHDPLSVVDDTIVSKGGHRTTKARAQDKFKNSVLSNGKTRIEYENGDMAVVYNMANGQSYRITVEELTGKADSAGAEGKTLAD